MHLTRHPLSRPLLAIALLAALAACKQSAPLAASDTEDKSADAATASTEAMAADAAAVAAAAVAASPLATINSHSDSRPLSLWPLPSFDGHFVQVCTFTVSVPAAAR